MAYGDFKDLSRRTASDKVLRDRAFCIAKNLTYDGCQRGLASMAYKCFNKKSSGGAINSEIMPNQRPLDLATIRQLAGDLHKPKLENLKREKYTHLLWTIFDNEFVNKLQICIS